MITLIIVLTALSGLVSTLDDGTYGNPITPGRTLTTIPRSFILTNKPLPVGQVSYFRFHSSGIDKKLYLQVWRRLVGIKNGYRLVGQVYHCTSYNGTTQVTVAADSPLVTQAGDLLGFTATSERVAITYTLAPFEAGALVSTMVLRDNVPPVPNNSYKFTGSFFEKMFALNVHITQDAANTSACLHDNGGCDQVCRGVGGRPVCTCLSGYDLLKDGRTCSDIDECATSPPVCAKESECVNKDGLYDCLNKQPASSAVTARPGGVSAWFSELLADPGMMAVYVWLILLTVFGLVTMVTACVIVRRVKVTAQASNLNFHNSNTLGSSLDQVTILKNNRY